MKQKVKETIEESLTFDGLCYFVIRFYDTITIDKLHFGFLIVVKTLYLLESVISCDLLQHLVIQLMMQACFLIVWIVSGLQVVEHLVHV